MSQIDPQTSTDNGELAVTVSDELSFSDPATLLLTTDPTHRVWATKLRKKETCFSKAHSLDLRSNHVNDDAQLFPTPGHEQRPYCQRDF